jgi:hypothetical protein
MQTPPLSLIKLDSHCRLKINFKFIIILQIISQLKMQCFGELILSLEQLDL